MKRLEIETDRIMSIEDDLVNLHDPKVCSYVKFITEGLASVLHVYQLTGLRKQLTADYLDSLRGIDSDSIDLIQRLITKIEDQVKKKT